ncbi:MAG: amidase [Nitrososphaerales archaeon]|jgi:aspartyl-tRNA(Asn)/glutamyl-tRNA(Gln) amidotransferase subunit A
MGGGGATSSIGLRSLTAISAARSIRDGRITSEELVGALLSRIDETDGVLKAYVTVCRGEATEEARRADARTRSGADRLGPLHGVPVSIKDLMETKGIRTTAGSRLLSSYVPKGDASVVARLKKAGAIVIGKTNTHEFALGGITPPTCNPWDPTRIPGGSSGGSAAAVAAGSALASLGSDTGGSIRIPASFCGVVGLKPTYGRVSRAGVFPESWSLDHVGPITRTVEDCALLLTVISGRDPRDRTSSARPVPDYLSLARRATLEGMRVGVPSNYFFEPLTKGVRSTVGRAIKELARLGAVVEHFRFPMADEVLEAHALIDFAESSAYHEDSLRERAGEYQPDVRALLEQGLRVRAVDYIRAQRWRGAFLPRMRALFRGLDLVVTPCQPMVAPKHGTRSVPIDGRGVDLDVAMTRFVAPFDFTGHPALSINCGFSDGLPVGLQLVADHYDEGRLLSAALAYERATRWGRSHPDL